MLSTDLLNNRPDWAQRIVHVERITTRLRARYSDIPQHRSIAILLRDRNAVCLLDTLHRHKYDWYDRMLLQLDELSEQHRAVRIAVQPHQLWKDAIVQVHSKPGLYRVRSRVDEQWRLNLFGLMDGKIYSSRIDRVIRVLSHI